MYSIIKDLGPRMALKKEAGPFFCASAVAEFFFKFGSFALECVAFLAVWFALGFLQSLLFGRGGEQELKT